MLGFVDVPGHEKFVHNMLAGASGIDFVLLVIAADDGVMPQTREHLAIIDLLGVTRGIVALTKVDLVAPPQRDKVAADIAQLLEGTGFAGAEIVPISTITGEGVDSLRQRLFDAAATMRARAATERFRMTVDRSFTLAGIGTVVTGHHPLGSGVDRRPGDDQPIWSRRARALDPCTGPADRSRGWPASAARSIFPATASPRTPIARGQIVLDPRSARSHRSNRRHPAPCSRPKRSR